jgi:serine/threonine-protein kinase
MPSRVGRYELLARIASGGMATVYLARARGVAGFEREVALKLTHAHLRESPEFTSLLVEEAKLAGRIRHTNVVSILDVGEDPLGLFLVMDYVEGDTLSGLQRRHLATRGKPLPIAVGMRVLLDALEGLHAAHELRGADTTPLGVVHRDFSPQNVLVGCDGVAKLADFGIAKATARVGNTATGVVKGKAAYMAPEQARGHSIDRRSDVWAAGVVAWELFAGRRLYGKGDEVPVLLKVISEPPPRLREVAEVTPQVDAAVASALEMDVEQRCPTASALAERLAEAFSTMGRVEDAPRVGALVRDLAGASIAALRAEALNVLDRTLPQSSRDAGEVRTSAGVAIPSTATATIAADQVAEATRTDTTSTTDQTTPARSAAKWTLVGGAALAVACVVALAASRPSTDASPPPAAAPAASQIPAESAPAVVAPPGPIASASSSASVPAIVAAPVLVSAPTPTRAPAPRPVSGGRTSPRPAPKSTAAAAPGKLAPAPW